MKKKYRILCILLLISLFSGMMNSPQIADAKTLTTKSKLKSPPANYSTRYMGWSRCKNSYMALYQGKYATMSYWDAKKTVSVEYFNPKFKSVFLCRASVSSILSSSGSLLDFLKYIATFMIALTSLFYSSQHNNFSSYRVSLNLP